MYLKYLHVITLMEKNMISIAFFFFLLFFLLNTDVEQKGMSENLIHIRSKHDHETHGTNL